MTFQRLNEEDPRVQEDVQRLQHDLPHFLIPTHTATIIANHHPGVEQEQDDEQQHPKPIIARENLHLEAEADHVEARGTLCCLVCSWRTRLTLKHFTDLPEWMKDNEFVQSCHRHNLTFSQALKSIFQIHCETVNIW
jgi:hypothetical protein